MCARVRALVGVDVCVASARALLLSVCLSVSLSDTVVGGGWALSAEEVSEREMQSLVGLPLPGHVFSDVQVRACVWEGGREREKEKES